MKIVDIAAAAGVSPSTVSRVISGNGKISPKTTALVHKAIRALGYNSSFKKRRKIDSAMSACKVQNVVAVMTFGDSSPLDLICCTTSLKNFSQALASKGLDMIYCHFSDNNQEQASWMHFVTGAIVLRGKPFDSVRNWLEERPFVTVSSTDYTDGDHLLSGDNAVGQLAGRYLLQRNLSHFVSLNVLPELPETVNQVKAFHNFAQENAVPKHDDLSSLEPFSLDFTRNWTEAIEKKMTPLVDRLLRWNDHSVGVFVPNDWMTAVACRLIQKKNGGGMGNYVLISSGNYPAAFCGLYPRPATINIGLEGMAKNAVNLLVMRIQASTYRQPLHVSIQPAIIPGDINV